MTVLDIGGQHVEVGDQFLSLSHDEQQSTVDEIASSLKSKPSEGSSLTGAAKALGTGVAQGVIGLAGIPGDLAALNMKMAGREATGALGSDDIQKNIEKYTGDFYKPQGRIEGALNTAGQFLPAVIGGPETMGVKLATRVAAPAIASEAAGALTGDNPYAKAAGALTGALAGPAAFNRTVKAMSKVAGPTAEETLKTAGDQFNAARDMNVVVKPDIAQNIAADMRSALKGFDPEAQKPVFNAIDRLESMGQSAPGLPPMAVPMNDMEFVRKQLINAKQSIDGPTREAARRALEVLNDGKQAITAADTIAGDASAYAKMNKDAVANYAVGKRSQIVQGKQSLGEYNAATAGSGANEDNALRQAFKQLGRPVNNTNMPVWQKLGFKPDEGALIDRASKGTITGNMARYLGKAAPTGIVSGMMSSGAGHVIGGPVGAVALPVAGYIAKKIGDLSTKRAVNALNSLVLSKSPLAASVASRLPPQIVNQLAASSQRILQTVAPQSQPQSASLSPTPRSLAPIPPLTAPPIFAAPASAPPRQQPPSSLFLTAVGDGQPPRPSRVGLGDNIRLGKYQDWTDGRIVKVGFVDGLKVEGVVPAIYHGDAPGFILSKGDNVYRVTPHRGMEKLSSSDGAQALKDARQNNRK